MEMSSVASLSNDQRDELGSLLDMLGRHFRDMHCDLVVDEFKIKDSGLVSGDHPFFDNVTDVMDSLKLLRDSLSDWQDDLISATRAARNSSR